MIDVIIPLGTGCDWKEHNELKYCLRSIEKNLVDLGKVYVVGHKPNWLTNVIHIPAEDTLTRNKDGNIINKTLLACKHPQCSQQFMRISDDQILLQSCTIEHLQPGHSGDLKLYGKWRNQKWLNRLKRTYEYLRDNDYTTFNYDIHIPFVANRDLFIQTWQNIDFESDIGYCINTMFFNVNFSTFKNNEYIWQQKCTIEKPIYFQDIIIDKLKDKRFLGYGPRGLNDHLKIVIKNLFPCKSKYEL